jgi:hypothetical protein
MSVLRPGASRTVSIPVIDGDREADITGVAAATLARFGAVTAGRPRTGRAVFV